MNTAVADKGSGGLVEFPMASAEVTMSRTSCDCLVYHINLDQHASKTVMKCENMFKFCFWRFRITVCLFLLCFPPNQAEKEQHHLLGCSWPDISAAVSESLKCSKVQDRN